MDNVKCRTRVFENRFGKKTSTARGNISFTTANIVMLALESTKEADTKECAIKLFYKKLDSTMELIGEQLYERFLFQSKAKAKQFKFLMKHGIWDGGEKLCPDDTVGDVIKNGSLTIGFLGLAEALVALTGRHHGEDEHSRAIGYEIVQFMQDKTKELADKYDLNIGLIATPSESACGTLLRKTRDMFGVIDGVTDRDYLTNSFHVPVYYDIAASKKIEIEAPFHAMCLGGHISYVELDTEASKNITGFMQIVKKMLDENIGYGSINHTTCRCLSCGYDSLIVESCPACGEQDNISRISRITGYLVGDEKKWNSAKKAELKDRVKHT